MVNKHVRPGICDQPSLSSGGWPRLYPFRSLGKSDLSCLRQAEDLAGPSLKSGQECLPESSQAARTGFVSYGIGPLAWCNSLRVPSRLVECASRPNQESQR